MMNSPASSHADFEPAAPVDVREPGTGLSAHMMCCLEASGRWFPLRCAVEALDAFCSGRFVTTVLLAVIAIGSVSALV